MIVVAKYNILLVEDEEAQREALAAHLEDEQYMVIRSASAEQALAIAFSQAVDAIISDFNLPGDDGQVLLDRIKAMNPTIPVILITAYGTVDRAVLAMKSGAFDYLTKPIHIDELLLVLKRALQQKQLVEENKRLQHTLEKQFSFTGMVATSRAMQQVLNLAGRVADSKATVLLRGESGTGKEVLAKAVHYASPRKEGPFIAFNVAALSPTLIESELFGHEKGSFTGADRLRLGRFEQAHGGTIFIDEIGDIPVELQTKFLRVLQESEIERIGGNVKIPIDIRIIAATNRDLELLIKNGSFREDLYYRINVVSIPLPPLRERKEDIVPLCQYFLQKNSVNSGRGPFHLNRSALDSIIKYDFPGNIRELENLIERACILCRDQEITPEDLPPQLFESMNEFPLSANGGLEQKVEALERRLIAIELRKCGGNQSKAARHLKITERKLRYKIKKYSLI
jgi:DNA-binding NtrC family response regulator